jgi:hypothetical protein
VDIIFVYALTWSLGGNLDADSRNTFSTILKETITKLNTEKGWKVPIPEGTTGYYDVTINCGENEFMPWANVQNEFTFNSRMS